MPSADVRLARRVRSSLHGGTSRSSFRTCWRTCHLVRPCSPVVDCACTGLRPSGTLIGPGREIFRSRRVLCRRCSRMGELNESIAFLRERIAGLDQQRARLVRALEALQDEPPPPVPASPAVIDGASTQEEPAPLTTRILAVLRKSGPLNRRQLLRACRAHRCQDRDARQCRLQTQGPRIARQARRAGLGIVEPQAVAAGTGAEAGASLVSDRSSGSARRCR